MKQQTQSPETPVLYEAVDINNMPLLHMPFPVLLRQKLWYRLAVVALFTRDKRLIISKRKCQVLQHQGLWDVFTSPVLARASYEDTAISIATLAAQMIPTHIRPVTDLPILQERAFVQLFKALLPHTIHPSQLHTLHNVLLVDQDELHGLLTATPELFTPEVHWIANLQLFTTQTS